VLQKRVILFASVTGILAIAAIAAMPQLVAKPKLLFGRSLSAIDPTLFPLLTLVSIAVLSLGVILLARHQLHSKPDDLDDLSPSDGDDSTDWISITGFFAILIVYALMFKPFGFLISSFIAIAAAALMLGNRNWLQIIALALICPVGLYLVATRGMLVALPELNAIELFYSHLFAWNGEGL